MENNMFSLQMLMYVKGLLNLHLNISHALRDPFIKPFTMSSLQILFISEGHKEHSQVT